MRTDRWNKKRELNLYAFYDHTGLERHLEKMAANGWMLESVGTYALRYRRCEPKKLRFAVVYYPKTDSFCPDEPNHENLTFWDYCADAGWQIVTQRGDTHIFYNEDLDAVPIETEAVVQVETMERAKKGYVLSNTITVACMLPTMLYLQVSQLRRDPVAFLADGYDLTMMLMIFVMILLFGVELLGYRLWLRKAKRNARELGIFTPTHSSRWLSFLRSIWIFVFWALMVVPLLFRSAGLCIVLVSAGAVLVPVGGAVLVGKQVWKRSVPPKKRRLILALTVLCSVLLSVMLMIGVMTYGISSGWFDDVPKNAEEYTYTVGGSPQVGYLYHDTLPLYVQGLTDTDYARYSCEALERGDSVFVRQVEYRQELPYDVRWSDENDPPLPELFYTVIDVKLAPLFDFCLQSTLHAEDLYGSEYRETDPAPWGADRAWRECDAHSGEKYDTWLLIYGQRIVEFHPRSFSPDAAQMAVIGETLGK